MDTKTKTNIETILQKMGNSSDINYRYIKIGRKTIGYIYLDSTSSDDKISDFLLKRLTNIDKQSNLYSYIKNNIPNSNVKEFNTYKDIYSALSSGFTIIFVDGNNIALGVETKSTLDRGVNESSSEAVVRGPKDSFTENHMINIGLIRKRIKDPNLWFKEIKLGRRTNTKVSIVYIKDIANTNYVRKIEDKLNKIDIDGILDSGYIRDYLNTSKISIFPKMISTERPDLASQSLLNGKIVIMVENSPYVLIIPGLFVDYFNSPEDFYQKSINANFTRIIRYIAFIITVLTPAFYIVITSFNPEIIPKELLQSIIKQRSSVPFPPYIEIFLLILVFEILRECDIRIPQVMGTAISVVGGLVLGDAAVSAGIVSPICIIVVAITSICGLLFSDIDMVNGIRIWRILFIIGASFFGLIGIVIIGLIMIINLTSTEVMGIPYLTPISPFNNYYSNLLRKRINTQTNRPNYLTNNITKQRRIK